MKCAWEMNGFRMGSELVNQNREINTQRSEFSERGNVAEKKSREAGTAA